MALKEKKMLEGNREEIVFELPWEEFSRFVAQATTAIQQEIELPGFRKGKVPIETIQERFLGDIYEKAASSAIGETIAQYAEENKRQILWPLEDATVLKCASHNPFQCKARIVFFPRVQTRATGVIINRAPIAVEEKEIESELKKLILAYARQNEVDRASAIGDVAIIDLTILKDGVPIENGEWKNYTVMLNEEYELLPDMVKNALGKKKDEQIEYTAYIKEDHPSRDLAGKVFDFKATIKKVCELIMPTEQEMLAQFKLSSIDELKNTLRNAMVSEKTKTQEEKLEKELIDALRSKTTFDEIPLAFIDQEVDNMIADLKQRLEKNNFRYDDYVAQYKTTEEKIKEGMRASAEERIKNYLLLLDRAEQEKIVVDDKDIAQWKEARGNDLEKDDDHIRNRLLINKTIEALKKKCIE